MDIFFFLVGEITVFLGRFFVGYDDMLYTLSV